MRYDYCCSTCGKIQEHDTPIVDRDRVMWCCGWTLKRVFTPAQIMLPERFRMSMAALTPTYDECAEIDRRNDEYLNRKKEPAKPSFEDCLEVACVENRVDPKALENYQLKNLTLTPLESRISPNFAWGE